jgi:hypothetical protein
MLSHLAKKCGPETSATRPSHSILVVQTLQYSDVIVGKLEATQTSLLGVDHTGQMKDLTMNGLPTNLHHV